MSKTKKRNPTITEQDVHDTKKKVTLDKYTTNSTTMCDVLSKKEIPAKQEGVKNIMADENKPEHIRVGCIEVAIWTNNAGKGDYQTVTMQRSYKDKKDDWQKTNSLRTNDIPKAVLALSKAYEKIVVKE